MTTDSHDLDERLRQLGTHLDEERRIRRSMVGGAGVGGAGVAQGSSRGRRRPMPRLLLVAAVAAVVVAGGLAFALRPGGSPTSVDAALQEDDSRLGQDEPSPPPSGDGGEPLEGEPSLVRALDALPVGIDPVGGPLVFVGEFGDGPKQVALDYLSDRLPDLPLEVVELETAPADQVFDSVNSSVPLTLVRWHVHRPAGVSSGSVVIRADDSAAGVVAAIADGTEVAPIERSLDRVRVVVTDTDDDLLVADVMTVRGDVVAEAPFPNGFGDGIAPVIGTAGSTETERLEIDFELEPIPVIVRLQHLGGTWLTITEFAVDTVGFDAPCGPNPPVTIDVGNYLGALEDGPAPPSDRPGLINQGVWHHPGDLASIEIRWPSDPGLTSRLPAGTPADGEIVIFGSLEIDEYDASSSEESTHRIVTGLDPSPGGPCSFVQISVYGQTAVAAWWSTAISGELSFGLPLSIAELDPAVGPNGLDPDQAPGDGGLVVGVVEVAERPAVAATGSCDGLPNDPPRRGPGPGGSLHDEPAAALAEFVTGLPVAEPPLPTAGYTELTLGGEVIGYVSGSVDDPLAVIEVTRSDDGWLVDGWSAAPC